MIPKIFSMNDHLVQYLPYCRSFRNPPFHKGDPTILWEDNFLENILIPTLCNEAAMIAQIHKVPPITTSSGVFKLSLSNRRVFQCKLCAEGRAGNDKKPLDYKSVQSHLQTSHKVKKVEERMIMVDYLAVGKNLLKIDSHLVC